jgi:hypothetical protein
MTRRRWLYGAQEAEQLRGEKAEIETDKHNRYASYVRRETKYRAEVARLQSLVDHHTVRSPPARCPGPSPRSVGLG